MFCPDCKAKSVQIRNGQKVCQSENCLYLEFSVVSYRDQYSNKDLDKSRYDRGNPFSQVYQPKEDQLPEFLKKFKQLTHVIEAVVEVIGLNEIIKYSALDKLKYVLMFKYPNIRKIQQKEGYNKRQDILQMLKMKQQSNQMEDESRSNQMISQSEQSFMASNKQICGYCVWLACYEHGVEFRDVRIANQLGIPKKDWMQVHKEMQNKFKTPLKIPPVNIQKQVRRICKKRKIDKTQETAMLQMVASLRSAGLIDGYQDSTIAAFVFWQIMLRSTRYNPDDKFNINDYLLNQNKEEKEQQKKQQRYWSQNVFDVSADALIKYKKWIGRDLLELIPKFITRSPYIQILQSSSQQLPEQSQQQSSQQQQQQPQQQQQQQSQSQSQHQQKIQQQKSPSSLVQEMRKQWAKQVQAEKKAKIRQKGNEMQNQNDYSAKQMFESCIIKSNSLYERYIYWGN